MTDYATEEVAASRRVAQNTLTIKNSNTSEVDNMINITINKQEYYDFLEFKK